MTGYRIKSGMTWLRSLAASVIRLLIATELDTFANYR